MKTILLADAPHFINPLARLWYECLGKEWIPNATVSRAHETYETHLNRDALPLTLVGILNDQPVAMVSLRENDGIRPDLTPWLGSLIVHPDYRRQGIGEALIAKAKIKAKQMGYDTLYLFALDPALPAWYSKLGWRMIGEDKLYHHPVTVMETAI